VTRRTPSFWSVVVALLKAACRRATGRFRRLLQLDRHRDGRARRSWRVLVFGLVCLIATVPHLGTAIDIGIAIPTAEQVQAEHSGRVVAEEWFVGRTEIRLSEAAISPARRAQIMQAEDADIAIEAQRLADRSGGDATAIAAVLRQTVRQNPKVLLSKGSLWWQPGKLPDIFALFAIVWWALMLICQGEGPELDTLRPRYPMWEWLFSHPAPPSAVFLAEMIAPIAANPVYLAAPLFPALLFGGIYGWLFGVAAAVLVGVPIVVALACVGKAIQIWILLRFSPRTRGAALGVMGWFGFISILPIFLVNSSLPTVVALLGGWLMPLSTLPWPPVRRLAGLTSASEYVFWQGVALCWLLAAILILGALAVALASTRHGITGQTKARQASARAARPARFAREPLYRKELLWLRRDRAALIQTVLMPLSLAIFQVVNLHGTFAVSTDAWSTPCGLAILFGTYLLLVLGPKSLTSEGPALWIALTWPLGLESLLKAKARLWVAITSVFVGIALIYAGARYPADIGRVLIVAVLWWVFARSLAEKTTTLATVVSSSGEAERPPSGLRWAAMLGTLTFAIGIFTGQWSLAVAGIVYSIVTAAAMWQDFRYRLPYLWDPWSRRSPPAPTLLHAMVAISAMVEGLALFSALALALFGRDNIAAINAGLYGICAIVAALATSRFLAERGVPQRAIWVWREVSRGPLALSDHRLSQVITIVAGAALLGAVLGVAAHLYLAILHRVPESARLLEEAQQQMDALPSAHVAYAVMAVGLAPFAEEFLFRGLLYRALDCEWGGWRAIIGAAAFFAVYHPTLSWAPVAALGALNAMLYKRSGLLAAAVAAHMAYNATILAF
jgi:membrane protease YdiL (CAAX protease family)